MRLLCVGTMFLAIPVYAWSAIVWTRCGYDCGLLGIARGPAAIATSFASIVVFGLAVILLVFTEWHRKKQK